MDERPPKEPIDNLLDPLLRFMRVEAASGIVLFVCAAIALTLANSRFAETYLGLWETPLTLGLGEFELSYSLRAWINEALMAVFFFVVGLEVKREIVLGELREMKRAALPIIAAFGGMVGPALVYLAFQHGQPAQDGWGIPMATDIAFVVGCLALISSRVPRGLRVLLLSLAIADDIGAILVIAFGYTAKIQVTAFALGILGLGAVYALGRFGVRSLRVFIAVGSLVWLAFHESGVHATIAGVALGMMTPARSYASAQALKPILDRVSASLQGDTSSTTGRRADRVRQLRRAARESLSPLEYLEATLHPWVGFVIMPLFALANAGVPFRTEDLSDSVALAVGTGLVVGKPLGIVLASWLATRLGLAKLPDGVGWIALIGGGLLAGIGFTMALFITELALSGTASSVAKVGVLAGSLVSALLGTSLLWLVLPRNPPTSNASSSSSA